MADIPTAKIIERNGKFIAFKNNGCVTGGNMGLAIAAHNLRMTRRVAKGWHLHKPAKV